MRTIACLLLYLMALTGLYGATGGGGGVTLINVTNIFNSLSLWTNTGSEVYLMVHSNRLRLLTNTIFGTAIQATSTNTALGLNALSVNAEGRNVAIGTNAMGESISGYQNIAIGNNVLRRDTSAGGENVAIGHFAMPESVGGYWTVAIGEFALAQSIDGFQNVAIGKSVLAASTNVSDTVAIGFRALDSQVTGSSNVAVGSMVMDLNNSGTQNTVVGDTGMRASIVGSRNVSVGSRSLLTSTNDNNTAVGFLSGSGLAGGRENIFIGSSSGTVVPILSNTVVIGSGANAWTNNQMVLGTNITNYVFANVDYNMPTSRGAFDTFLKHDGVNNLAWSSNLSLLVVTNMEVVNNTVLSNVTVKGDLIITNITLGGANVRTNQYTTNISGTPVIGSFWFQGTNGAPVTNVARVALEWIPVMRSLRIGELGANGASPDPFDSTTPASNYWAFTNVGFGSIAMGSNVMVQGRYSTVLNGIWNIIRTNAIASTIVGGSNNIIYTNCAFSLIGGGAANYIRMNSDYSTIVGGGGGAQNGIINSDWAFIGGGQGNTIQSAGDNSTIVGGSVNTIVGGSAFIGGGANNAARADYSAIVGGQGNQIPAAGVSTHAFIGGGQNNDISQGSTHGTVSGGSDNDVGVAGVVAAPYGTIGGGQTHRVNAPHGTIAGGKENIIATSMTLGQILGGASNNVTVVMGTAIGNFVTNSTASSVEIGHGATGGNNRKLRVDVNGARVMTYNGSATVGGTYLITNTPIASAGSAETNLQVVTVGAHVLTNNNDRLLVRGSGRFAATSNTKQVQLVYGSEDVFDSGAFVANTGAWTLDCEIIRTGNTSQSCNCSFNGGTNVVYVRTSSLDLAQTNGIATVLKITGTASGNGDITNRTLTVEWRPST